MSNIHFATDNEYEIYAESSGKLIVRNAITRGNHSISATFDFSELPKSQHAIFLRAISGMMPIEIAVAN